MLTNHQLLMKNDIIWIKHNINRLTKKSLIQFAWVTYNVIAVLINGFVYLNTGGVLSLLLCIFCALIAICFYVAAYITYRKRKNEIKYLEWLEEEYSKSAVEQQVNED